MISLVVRPVFAFLSVFFGFVLANRLLLISYRSLSKVIAAEISAGRAHLLSVAQRDRRELNVKRRMPSDKSR
jgi:hypothetical protein